MLVRDLPVIPEKFAIFAPSNPLSRNHEARFNSLEGVDLTGAQKDFIAGQCLGNIGDEVDIRFGESGRAIKRRYSLTEGTVNVWIKNVRNGVKNADRRGPPNALDEQGLFDFHTEVKAGKTVAGKGRKHTKALFTHEEVSVTMSKHARLTKVRRGHENVDVDEGTVALSRKTVEKIKKVRFDACFSFLYSCYCRFLAICLSIVSTLIHQRKAVNPVTGESTRVQSGKGQVQTTARNSALSCVRMAVQQAVMVEAKMGHLPDWQKWNVDASTMIIKTTGTDAVIYRIVSNEEADAWEQKLLKDPLTTVRFQSGLDMGLKWMHLGNGNGDFGPMTLIIAVPGMPEGRFYYCEVKGLVFGEDSTKIGRVYFAKTRCMKGLSGNEEADTENSCNPWSHYFQNPFIQDIDYYARSYNTINPDTNEPYESVCTIDGESCIDRELLDPAVFEKLSAAKIQLVKNRPSGTEKDNSNDASDNFRDKNTGLQMCVSKCIDTSNSFLEANLRDAFAAMRAAYPSVTMTAEHQRKVIGGCTRFVYVCRNKYVTPQKQVIGFQRTFETRVPNMPLLYPIPGREKSTVDAARLINHLCTTAITTPDMENIIRNFNEMVAIQDATGRVDNEVMDRLQICKLPVGEHKDRDRFCLAQQGPLDLTHPETRLREAGYNRRKEIAAEEKAYTDAHALVQKTEEKKLAAVKKKLEKDQVTSLTKEQKKIDPACMNKKQEAKSKKLKADEKTKNDTAALVAAKTLINAART